MLISSSIGLPDVWLTACHTAGFTLEQAWRLDRERERLATPLRLHPGHLRRHPWMRALAWWQRTLRTRVLAIHTPEAWETYQTHWWTQGWEGPLVDAQGRHGQGNARTFVAAYWSLLSLGAVDQPMAQHPDTWRTPLPKKMTWKRLADARAARRGVVAGLIAAFPHAKPCSWATAFRMTGLRAVRWSPTDTLSAEAYAALPGALVAAQAALATPLALTGPLLGLDGATTLVLLRGGELPGHGHVRLDPERHGQQLYLDAWSVLAHEWLHTLDATIARRAQNTRHWITLGLMEDEPFLPPDPALAALCETWWDQVVRVQWAPLPPAIRTTTERQLRHWDERIEDTLGRSLDVVQALADETERMAQDDWSEVQARERWYAWLMRHRPGPAALLQRTAALFAAEQAWAKIPDRWARDVPLWASFLQAVAEEVPDAPMGPRTDRMTYLTSPVELMARSFEASFAPRAPLNPVWPDRPSKAGMIWPLPAEATYQARGWQACLAALAAWQPVYAITPAASKKSSEINPLLPL